MKLIDPASGQVLANVEVARGLWARIRGLLGRATIEPGEILALPGRQVHTIGMRFPIDVAYLSSQGRILETRRIHPWRIGPYIREARWVLEMAPGEVERMGLQTGHTVQMDDR